MRMKNTMWQNVFSRTWALLLGTIALLTVSQVRAEVIKFQSLGSDRPMQVSGVLHMPSSSKGAVPAMIVVHGTGGTDTRTRYFAQELPRVGVAVLEVDFKTGVFSGPADRPPNNAFLPAAFAALKVLAQDPRIDPKRIGIMGFSLGGQLTMTAALTENKNRWLGYEGFGFAVHVAFYPGCVHYIPKLTSDSAIAAPLLVMWGTRDSYGDGEACVKLEPLVKKISNNIVSMVALEGGHHGFDGDVVATFRDRAAVNSQGYIEGNPQLASQSRAQAIAWIVKYLGP